MPPSLCLKYKCAVSFFFPAGHVAEQTSAELELCEAASQQTDRWIHLGLLYKQTGTRNVNQSFNSNLAWPVVTYIIINHPCQLAHTNCWVLAINTWTPFWFLSLSSSPYIFVLLHGQESTSGDAVSLLFLGGGAVIGCIPLAHRLCNLGKRRAPEIDQIFLSFFFFYPTTLMLFQCVARPANGEELVGRWGNPAGFLDWSWNRNRFSKVTRLDRLRESAAGGPYGSFSFQRRPSLPLHSKNKWDQSFSLFYFFYSLPPSNVQAQVV